MSRSPFFKLTGVSLVAASLSSCGQNAPSSTAPAAGEGAAAQRAYGQPGEGKRLGGAMALFADLALTEDQKAQLKAIAEKYRAQWPTSPWRRVRELLTAEVVDAAALRAALTEEPSGAERQSKLRGMLVEVRAVLTEVQKAQVVAKLQAAPLPQVSPATVPAPSEAERAAWLDRVGERLGLTADQKAAFGAFLEKQRDAAANRPAPIDHAARRDAMVRFIQTGDATALDAIKPQTDSPRGFAVEEFVTLATKLSQAQRQALFGRRGHRG
jgi:Spy/CpxP family protein refolding chaperone